MFQLLLLAVIFFPVIWAILYILFRSEGIRTAIKWTSVLFSSIGAVYIGLELYSRKNLVVLVHLSDYSFEIGFIFKIITLAVICYLAYVSFKSKVYVAGVLSVFQLIFVIFQEILFFPKDPELIFKIDLMAFIIYVLFVICGGVFFSVSSRYMQKYFRQINREPKKRTFFGVGYYLLSVGVAGVLFTQHLMWLYLFLLFASVGSLVLMDISSERPARLHNKSAASNLAILVFVILYYQLSGNFSFNWIVPLNNVPGILAGLFVFVILYLGWNVIFDGSIDILLKKPTPLVIILTGSSLGNLSIYLLFKTRVLIPEKAWPVLVFFGALLFLSAAFKAATEDKGRHILAWFSIAFNGFYIFCIYFGNSLAEVSFIALMVVQTVTIAYIGICVSAVEYRTGTQDVEKMYFLMNDLPFLAALMGIGISMFLLFPFAGSMLGISSIYLASKQFIFLFILIAGFLLSIITWLRWLSIIIVLPQHSDIKVEKDLVVYRIVIPFMLLLSFALNVSVGWFSSELIYPYVLTQGFYKTDRMFWRSLSVLHGENSIIYLFAVMVLVILAALIIKSKLQRKSVKPIYNCGNSNTFKPVLYNYSIIGSGVWIKPVLRILEYITIANIIILFGVTL